CAVPEPTRMILGQRGLEGRGGVHRSSPFCSPGPPSTRALSLCCEAGERADCGTGHACPTRSCVAAQADGSSPPALASVCRRRVPLALKATCAPKYTPTTIPAQSTNGPVRSLPDTSCQAATPTMPSASTAVVTDRSQ